MCSTQSHSSGNADMCCWVITKLVTNGSFCFALLLTSVLYVAVTEELEDADFMFWKNIQKQPITAVAVLETAVRAAVASCAPAGKGLEHMPQNLSTANLLDMVRILLKVVPASQY